MNSSECQSFLKAQGYDFRVYSPPIQEKIINPDIIVSLIIPIYNAEKYLKRLLQSIVDQTSKGGYEVILVNDGSTDNSLNIVKYFAEANPNIFKVINQENRGISGARNRGVEESSGQYIGFIDNDDYILPTYLERIIEVIKKCDPDVVQTGIREEKDNGTCVSETEKFDATYDGISVEDLRNLSGYVWDGVYRSTMFSRVYFPPGFWYEDMITPMLLLRAAKRITVIKDILYVKTDHMSNASKVLWSKRDLKSIDQYWLAHQLTDYGIHGLGCNVDDVLHHCLLYEYGPQLYRRTFRLDSKVRNVVFNCAANHYNSVQWPAIVNDKYRVELSRAFKARNPFKWKMICLSWAL